MSFDAISQSNLLPDLVPFRSPGQARRCALFVPPNCFWRTMVDGVGNAARCCAIVAKSRFSDITDFSVARHPISQHRKYHRTKKNCLTLYSTRSSILSEANLDGSLIAAGAAGVSLPRTVKLLPLAAISPPNPDQLRVAPSGATLSFLVPQRIIPTLNNKEI